MIIHIFWMLKFIFTNYYEIKKSNILDKSTSLGTLKLNDLGHFTCQSHSQNKLQCKPNFMKKIKSLATQD